jgi:hypothetical protein
MKSKQEIKLELDYNPYSDSDSEQESKKKSSSKKKNDEVKEEVSDAIDS